MSDAIEFPMESDGGHLVDPPIVDSLQYDPARAEWVISFVPEESVSSREKELVVVPSSSAEGRRVALRVGRLSKLLGYTIIRIIHGGDGNFVFFTDSNRRIALADPHGRIDLSVRA